MPRDPGIPEERTREAKAWKDLDDKAVALVRQHSDRQQQPETDRVPVAGAASDTEHTCLDPPGEAEVLAKLPKKSNGDHPPFYKTQRNNVRIVVEKIGDKVDPVKVYPLAGPCQLVHKHYKCTAYFDELTWSDDSIPFHHIDHKVEVVYVSKDHLRRAGLTLPAVQDPVEDRLDRLSREIRQLKLARRRGRGEQERILDRLIGEFEDLKRDLRDDPKDAGGAPPLKIR